MAPYEDRYVSIKLTRFYMKIVGFWYAENQREQWILQATLTYTIAAVIFAISVEGVDLYYSWGDFDAVTYNACCTMPLISIAMKITVFMIRRSVVIDLITFSEKNFWRTTYDHFGEQVLKECEKRGVLLLYTLAITTQGTVLCYVLLPMVENSGPNSTERNLPFRLWVNLPVKETPYYQIAYLIQALSALHSGICFFCFDNFMGVLNIHIVGQFRILQRRIETLCDQNYESGTLDSNLPTKPAAYITQHELSKKYCNLNTTVHDELKDCVNQHLRLIDYVLKLEEVFNLILLCQMGVSSLLICLGGFEIFVAKLSLVRRITFVFHSLSSLSQLLIFTWTCNELIVESLKIGDAAFCARWYKLPHSQDGQSIRYALMMIMIRARRACYISAGKFSPISLQAFTSILSTTLSYFTLLRQMSEEL